MHCALIPIDYVDTGYGRVLETSCWLCSDGAVHCCIFHHLPLLFWLSSASVKIHSTSSSVSGTSDIRLTATMDQTCKQCFHGRGGTLMRNKLPSRQPATQFFGCDQRELPENSFPPTELLPIWLRCSPFSMDVWQWLEWLVDAYYSVKVLFRRQY